jgi:hypothetical protein
MEGMHIKTRDCLPYLRNQDAVVSIAGSLYNMLMNKHMPLLDRLFNRRRLPQDNHPTIETVATAWAISPAHATFYVNLYASRFNLTYQEALNLLQDLPLENVRGELGDDR